MEAHKVEGRVFLAARAADGLRDGEGLLDGLQVLGLDVGQTQPLRDHHEQCLRKVLRLLYHLVEVDSSVCEHYHLKLKEWFVFFGQPFQDDRDGLGPIPVARLSAQVEALLHDVMDRVG